MLNGKKVIVGVTGSIAAYKSALLIRLLVKEGAEVKVVMTPAAKDFITPLTLSTLSKNPALSEFVKNDRGEWNNHVELGLWADLMVIAPASANTLAKMSSGICDNLLLAVYLSAKCPVYFAPAMDLDMHAHPATEDNIKRLQKYGNTLIPVNFGELASGLTGEGRMAEPEEIVTFIKKDLQKHLPLSGKKALVTAGPTCESIDPVRFIGNHSSGKMGFAIAEELARKGAEVMLITGPVSLSIHNSTVQRHDVVSAKEMYEACMKNFAASDIIVMSAAVADYTPATVSLSKIKKEKRQEMELRLKATEDILARMGEKKSKKQFLVGFALESENEIENAKKKIRSKNLNLVVLNSLRDEGAGFRHDTNKVTLLDRHNKISKFELKSKQEVARDIVKHILEELT